MSHYQHLSINEREKILVLYTEKKTLHAIAKRNRAECVHRIPGTQMKQQFQSLNLPFCFPDPQAPWQSGTNENTNGVLREYLPKSFGIALSSDNQIAEFINKLNHRPRKCLNRTTPFDVFLNPSLHLT